MKKKNNWIRGIIAAPVCAAALILAGCALESEHSPPPENMVLVRGGSFQMGSNDDDWPNEKPVHKVTLKSFYLGKYEVTQKEWFEIMGTTVEQQRDMADKSFIIAGEGDNYPMYYVSWYEAVEYCNTLSEKENLTKAYMVSGTGDSRTVIWNKGANGYRLPTEAEWEYAARGGNDSPGDYEYAGSNNIDEVAWYVENSEDTTHPVGSKMPNALGLYDMSGNVWEWCWDWYGNYASGAQTNPVGASSGSDRVNCGGGWRGTAARVRSTIRDGNSPSHRRSDNLGFRLVRP